MYLTAVTIEDKIVGGSSAESIQRYKARLLKHGKFSP